MNCTSAVDDERAAWFRTNVLPLQRDLKQLAKSLSRNHPEDADDLVSETFARLYSSNEWPSIASPGAYARRTLRNIALDVHRRRACIPMDCLGDLSQLEIADPAPTPELVLSNRSELSLLNDAIAALPGPLQRAVTLRLRQGLSHREIAESLHLSLSSVEKYLARAQRLCAEFVTMPVEG